MLRTDQMNIDPAYRAALAACGLARVEDVLARIEGRVAAWSRSTDTLHVPGPDGGPGFYVKRYLYPTWRKRLRTALRGTFIGLPRGQAEYRALKAMAEAGVSAVRPVAYGARRVGHFVCACFLITEEVPGACNLTTFARDVACGRRTISGAQRRLAVWRLADQVAHMHAAGCAHGQLFWRNILIRRAPDGAPEFFFLDPQPRRWHQVGGPGWWKRELVHLAVSAEPFTTRAERLCFLLRYFRARALTPELKAHARDIAALAGRWRRHEAQRIKMNDLFEAWNRRLVEETRASRASARPAGGAGPPG